MTERPRLSLAYLHELRVELDACLTLLRDDSRHEGGDKHKQRQPCHRQFDLFVPKTPPVLVAASERTKLLPLVSALLSETLSTPAVTEAGDEVHV